MNLSMILLSDIIILFLKDKKKLPFLKKSLKVKKKDFFPSVFFNKICEKNYIFIKETKL